MSPPEARRVRRPPYDLSIAFRVNDEAVVRIARMLDAHMGWSGRPTSPAARSAVEYVLGVVELKQAGEARRREREQSESP